MQTYVRNLLEHPDEAKFRRIRKENKRFTQRLGRFRGGLQLCRAIGFQDKGDGYLV